jgi:glutathione S-transferase
MPLTLYSLPTPNGQAASIFLFQLRRAYPNNETLKNLKMVKMSAADKDIGKIHNHVKAQWYLDTVNPNGKLPAIVHDGFAVFETSAILLYLAEEFDSERKFSFDTKHKRNYSEQLQWLFFVVRLQSTLVLCSFQLLMTMTARRPWTHARSSQSFQALRSREDVRHSLPPSSQP